MLTFLIHIALLTSFMFLCFLRPSLSTSRGFLLSICLWSNLKRENCGEMIMSFCFQSQRGTAGLIANGRPKEEKKSSVGSTWWNWKTVRCYAALHLRVHCTGTFADCTNFHFENFISFLFTSTWRSPGSLMGDSDDNPSRLTLTWREGRSRRNSLVNQPYPCVCIRNDFVNPCEEPDFWWDFLAFSEWVFVLSSRCFFLGRK